MVPARSHKVPRVSWYSGSRLVSSLFMYGAFTLSGRLSQNLSIKLAESIPRSEPRHARTPVWPLPISLAATLGITCCFLFLALLRCFSSGGSISGSLDICSSPKLFAAYHVFHRLLVPRHPPCALSSLTNFYILHSVAGVGSGCLCSQTVHLSMLLFLLGCLVSIFCVRYLCILLYAIFKVQRNRCKI